MSFSFDNSTNIGKVRQEVGDTEETTYILSDEEIAAIILEKATLQTQALEAAARIVNRLALNSYDVQSGQQRETTSQRILFYKQVQQRLRAKYLIGKLAGE